MKVNNCNHAQLGKKSNDKNIINRCQIINPLRNSSINASSIVSYSIYQDHSVLITTDGEIFALGCNKYGCIIGSLPKSDLEEFTKFEIKDKDGHIYHPISALCGYDYTLYLVSPNKNSTKYLLAYSYSYIKTEYPIFLNIGEKTPISLFGGYTNAAVIDSEGSIIFIPETVRYHPTNELESSQLPNNEEAISIACCNSCIYALSSNGNVYNTEIDTETEYDQNELNFEKVESLENVKINEISGTSNHCFAITEEGKVYGCGSNYFGELCVAQETNNIYNFEEIVALKKFDIKSAYAGFIHSLFITKDGKLLACGSNENGDLLCNEPSKESVYYPHETEINENAEFCVAGKSVSAVFIGNDPIKSPNRKINSF